MAKSIRKRATIPVLGKWHRNDIFKAIEVAGLQPRDFTLTNLKGQVRIKHKWSTFLFVVGGGPGHYVGRYNFTKELDRPYDAYSSHALLERVEDWLSYLRRDLDTPDLWAELRREAELVRVAFDEETENTPFTPEERKQIAERLKELGANIQNQYSLSPAQVKTLETKLDYLAKAANRVGRKDWHILVIGAILATILSAALPPDTLHGIVQTSFRAIGLLSPPKPIDE